MEFLTADLQNGVMKVHIDDIDHDITELIEYDQKIFNRLKLVFDGVIAVEA